MIEAKSETIAIWALLGALAAQLLFIGLRDAFSFHSAFLEEGDILTFPVSLQGVELQRLGSDCTIGFICTTSCAHCARLASQYSGLFEENSPFWFILGLPEDSEKFRQEHNLPINKVLSLGRSPGGFSGLNRSLRVPVTPLRIILDRDFKVLELSTTQILPEENERSWLCSVDSHAGESK